MLSTQVTIVAVAALISCACATGYGGGGGGAGAGGFGGAGRGFGGAVGGGGYGGGGGGGYGGGQNYPPRPYQFDYNANDGQGTNHYRNEQGDGSGAVRGTYGYTDAQGLYRVVEYVADAGGFRANIRTNEPGTDGKESPADVNLVAEQPPAGIQDRYTRVGGGGGYGGGAGGGYGGGAGGAGAHGGGDRLHYPDGSGAVRGTYGYTDAQGLYRVVEYVADAGGFRANIRTNEPGTDGKESPADVNLVAEQPPAGIQDRYTRVGGGGGYGGGAGGGYGGGAGGAGAHGGGGGAGAFRGGFGGGAFRGGAGVRSGKSGY